MDNKFLLGRRIKELRLKKHLCQEKLASIIGVEPTSLSNIETGKNYPLLITLEKITEALGVTFLDVFQFSQNTEQNELLNEIIFLLKTNPNKIDEIYKITKVLVE